MRRSYAVRRAVNVLMLSITGLCAVAALAPLLIVLGYIAWKGLAALSWGFLVHLPKPSGETGGGIANAIIGSAKIVALAGAFGIPVGVFGGVYLAEFGGGRLGHAIRFCADVLNGIPSIVMGLFAYALIVLPMKRFSGLSASVALAVIMIPIVLRSTEEFVRLVPHTLREAGLALGLPRWKVVLRVVVPTASRGIVTGSLLALSRAAGETAPLIFTAFGNRFWDSGYLQPMASLPLTIFTYAVSPYEDLHQQAWAAAAVLMIFVLIVNLGTRLALKPSTAPTH